jgi:hypothetical protein
MAGQHLLNFRKQVCKSRGEVARSTLLNNRLRTFGTKTPAVMRIVGEIPHDVCKITLFSWNNRYLIKLELGFIGTDL